jgi:hypothetical protein
MVGRRRRSPTRRSAVRLRSAVAPAVLATLAVAASSAQAAPSLDASYPCYGSGESLLLSGSGFTPQETVTLSVSGQQIATIGTDPDGDFTARVQAPNALFGTLLLRFSAADRAQPGLRAGTTVRIAATDVVISPTVASPSRLRRVQGWGFFDARAVYAHVKRHGAKRARNIRLGTPRGACGRLDVKRRLFPRGVRPGSYTLQFDTLRRYYPNLASGISYVVAVFGQGSSRASAWSGGASTASFARLP